MEADSYLAFNTLWHNVVFSSHSFVLITTITNSDCVYSGEVLHLVSQAKAN